jgi:ATP-dependent exoDNAse (exonuclease V) beta subunit
MTAWSYSSIKTFDQCPKKYYHLKVAKDVKDSGSEATMYGQALHSAAEYYVKGEKELDAKFDFMRPLLDRLRAVEGDKLCELKLGVSKSDSGYAKSTFFAKDVWWRGIADLVIIQGDTAYSIDYKTSKNAKYADTKQLDLVAAALFVHYPQLKKIKSALAFVVSNDLIHKEHTAELRDSYFETFSDELERLDCAQENDVWNAISGPLCGWCPVTSCEHHRTRR